MLKATPQNMLGIADVEFRKDDFDASIWRYGYDIIIDKAIRCPCEGKDGIPLSNCNNCHGAGYFYVNPIKTIGLISGVNRDTKFKEWSAELIGTISLSVRDNVDNTQEKIAFYDRVTLIKKRADQAPIFGYHTEILPIKTNINGKNFVFTSYGVQEVIDIFYFNGNENNLVRITDFTINGNNKFIIDFNNLPIINNGVVSVRYKHDVQYHVIDIPHEIRYSTVKNKYGRTDTITLPTNAICRRAHLVQIRENYDGTGVNNNTYLE